MVSWCRTLHHLSQGLVTPMILIALISLDAGLLLPNLFTLINIEPCQLFRLAYPQSKILPP